METIEILTEIIRHQNEPDNHEHLNLISDINFDLEDRNTSKKLKKKSDPNKVLALNDSKAVTDSLKEYLDNLNNAVVNAVTDRDVASGHEEEEDEISIRETLTIQRKGKSYVFGF